MIIDDSMLQFYNSYIPGITGPEMEKKADIWEKKIAEWTAMEENDFIERCAEEREYPEDFINDECLMEF